MRHPGRPGRTPAGTWCVDSGSTATAAHSASCSPTTPPRSVRQAAGRLPAVRPATRRSQILGRNPRSARQTVPAGRPPKWMASSRWQHDRRRRPATASRRPYAIEEISEQACIGLAPGRMRSSEERSRAGARGRAAWRNCGDTDGRRGHGWQQDSHHPSSSGRRSRARAVHVATTQIICHARTTHVDPSRSVSHQSRRSVEPSASRARRDAIHLHRSTPYVRVPLAARHGADSSCRASPAVCLCASALCCSLSLSRARSSDLSGAAVNNRAALLLRAAGCRLLLRYLWYRVSVTA